MFIGTPIIEQISSTELRITGISLPSTVSGTIAFPQFTGGANITLPDTFQAPSAEFQGDAVSLPALVQVFIAPDTSGPLTNLQPSVFKEGNTPETFSIKITNTNTSLATQGLEIYLILRGQVVSSGVTVNVIDSNGATVTVCPT